MEEYERRLANEIERRVTAQPSLDSDFENRNNIASGSAPPSTNVPALTITSPVCPDNSMANVNASITP